MNKITRDFISEEKRDFRYKMGTTVASALTGFMAGALAAIIIFLLGYYIFINK